MATHAWFMLAAQGQEFLGCTPSDLNCSGQLHVAELCHEWLPSHNASNSIEECRGYTPTRPMAWNKDGNCFTVMIAAQSSEALDGPQLPSTGNHLIAFPLSTLHSKGEELVFKPTNGGIDFAEKDLFILAQGGCAFLVKAMPP